MKIKIQKSVYAFVALAFFLFQGTVAFSQQAAAPADLIMPPEETRIAPMTGIFYNVVWGSLAGGLVMSGYSMLDDSQTKEERYKLSNILTKFVEGATYGGFIGLGAGVYLSLMGITFEEGGVTLDFEPIDESDFHGQQRKLYGNYPKSDYNQQIFSVQLKF